VWKAVEEEINTGRSGVSVLAVVFGAWARSEYGGKWMNLFVFWRYTALVIFLHRLIRRKGFHIGISWCWFS
jgi:hypothetical protein